MISLASLIQSINEKIANLAKALENETCSKEYVNDKVASLVNGAPEQLDTLQELSKALNNDNDFAATVNNSIAKKLNLTGGTITGNLTVNGVLNAKASSAITAESCTGNAASASAVAWENVTDKSNATTSAAGLMSAADKTKLDGIATQANKYSLPTASSSVLGGVKIGSNINMSSGTISVSNMKGATADAAGAAGLVPTPAKGKQTSFLRGDGAWVVPANTTYANFVKSGASAAAGLVPKPSTTAGTTHYLREDGTWAVPPNTNTTYNNFVKSGASAHNGLVPAPPTTAGTTKYLREDGTWQVPPDNNTTYSNMTAATADAAGKAGLVPAPAKGKQSSFLRGDGAWATPTNTTYSTGTTSTAGLTKLYTGIGDNTDGTMTQKAIKAIVGSGGGITAASLAANGYVKFANGLIVQWGNISGTNSQTKTINFPITFSSECYSALVIETSNIGAVTNDRINSKSKTGLTIWCGAEESNATMNWIAIGK